MSRKLWIGYTDGQFGLSNPQRVKNLNSTFLRVFLFSFLPVYKELDEFIINLRVKVPVVCNFIMNSGHVRTIVYWACRWGKLRARFLTLVTGKFNGN